jgi:hypothetical protein
MIKSLVETRSLLTLRHDVQALSQRSQGGGNSTQQAVSHFACFLFLGSQFSQVKKYVQAILFTVDEKVVLNTLENIIIEYVCSDSFEIQLGSLSTIFDLMRSFEYKLMAYLEMYHKLIEQNPLSDEEEKDTPDNRYEAQEDFIKMVQVKICAILQKQTHAYFEEQGFAMNHSSTKSAVEFLHSYLNVVTRWSSKIDIELNQPGLAFVCETLCNPQSQKDMLTQSSILFWSLLKLSRPGDLGDPFGLLMQCLCTDSPQELFENTPK